VTLTDTLDRDVVMMDIRMPVLDGIRATERLVSAGVRAKVLVLTTYGLDEYVYAALRAGAAGVHAQDRATEAAVRGGACGGRR
jgi:DNA-binding NarL/FixJ family response regulator